MLKLVSYLKNSAKDSIGVHVIDWRCHPFQRYHLFVNDNVNGSESTHDSVFFHNFHFSAYLRHHKPVVKKTKESRKSQRLFIFDNPCLRRSKEPE